MQHDLLTPAGIKERLAVYGLNANKALGQNFLADRDALHGMLAGVTLSGRGVLEIGPGMGALTMALCEGGARVVAVEKDAAMVRILKETLPFPDLQVLEGDILDTDLRDVSARLPGGPMLVAGNLPYYITTPIAMRLLITDIPIDEMLLMVQAEAAQRFYAEPGDRVYGPLAVLTSLQYIPEERLRLAPSSYYPQPEVTSAVVRLLRKDTNIPARRLNGFLQSSFAMRRKTLYNNLLAAGYRREAATAALAGYPASVRAEALKPEALYAIFQALE